MKGLVVVDVHVEFFSLDDEMKRFVIDKWHELTGSEIEDKEDCVRDAMTAYVMPLATVFANMDTLKWTPTCITSEDGFLIAFRKIDRLLYMAFSGDKRDTEQILTKKMYVAYRVISFLYGPVVKRICPEDLPSREAIWKKLSMIMDCYDRLYWDDLTFLLEAIEWLSFSSQLTPHDLKKACSAALDATCVKDVNHAMLIVNNKIALMRNNQRVTLSPIDQLMIVLMSNYYNGTAADVIQASNVHHKASDPNKSRKRPGDRLDRSVVTGSTRYTTSTASNVGSSGTQQRNVRQTPGFGAEQESEREPEQEVEQDQEPEREQEPDREQEPERDVDPETPCQTPIHVVTHTTSPFVTQPSTRSTSPIPEEGEEAPFDSMGSSNYNDLLQPVEGVFLKSNFEDELDQTLSASTNNSDADTHGNERDSASGLRGTIKSQGKKIMNYILGPNAQAQTEGESQQPEDLPEDVPGGLQGDDNFLSIIKHHKELVFLRQDVPHGTGVAAVPVPYFLHFITPTEGIVLAFTEEVACGALAVTIGSAIAHLDSILQYPTSEQPKTRIDQLDQCLKRTAEYMQRLVVGQKVSQTLSNIQSSWTTIKSMNIARVLRHGFTADSSSERLCNVLENMTKQLITLFDMVFIHSQFPSRLTIEAVMKVVIKTNVVLCPWAPILTMKGLENIPLATCAEQADDLVYYVFVDRRNNRVIAPSLAMLDNTGNSYLDTLAMNRGVQAGVFLREKVWACLHRIQKVLMNGYTSQMWLDDSFHYSFFLLLYHDSDEENDPLKVVEVNKDMDMPPGELTGSFYRRLRVGDGYLLQFYEILCLHEKFTPSSKAIAQSKRLVDNFIRTYLNNPAFRLL